MRIYLVCLMILLSSCSMFNRSSKQEDVNEVKEIESISIVTDIDLSRTNLSKKINLPESLPNDIWESSAGFARMASQNPAVGDYLVDIKKFDNGKLINKNFKLRATPIYANSAIFTIDSKGTIFARNIDNPKKILWRVKLPFDKNSSNYSNAAITYAGPYLIVNSGGAEIYLVDIDSGKVIWQKNINNSTRGAAAVSKGIAYINTSSNKLYAIDIQSSDILWTHQGIFQEISYLGGSTPYVENNIVLVTYSSGEVFALSAVDGKELWSRDANESLYNSDIALQVTIPAKIHGDELLMFSGNMEVLSFDIKTGNDNWKKQVGILKSVWVVGDYIFGLNKKNNLFALYKGQIIWSRDLPNKEGKNKVNWNGVILAGSKLILTNSNGFISFFNPFDGSIIESFEVANELYQTPIVANNKLFLLDNEANLYVINTSNDINKGLKDGLIKSFIKEIF